MTTGAWSDPAEVPGADLHPELTGADSRPGRGLPAGR